MSNILIIHTGLTGISNSCLALANRLQEDQHQVWISSIQDEKEKTEVNGLNYLEINPVEFDYKSNQGSQSKQDYFDHLIKKLDFESFDTLLRTNNIDLVLIDMELHEYILYLDSIKFRFVLLCQFFAVWQSKTTLPLSSTQLPKSEFFNNSIWTYRRLLGRLKTAAKSIKTRGLSRRNFIFYIADKLQFDTSQLLSYQFPLPFTYSTFSTLVMTHPELEFKTQEFPHIDFVHPLVHINRQEQIDASLEAEFDNILKRLAEENKQLIVVTRSSMQKSNARVIPMLLQALQNIPNTISIISLGKWYDTFKDKSESPNVILYQRIPQLKLLNKAALSINHGGIHTINECIHYQVPMLIISGEQFDQNGNAARVDNYGCGISLPPNQVTKESITSTINQMLNTPTYQNKIEELHQTYIDAKSNRVLEKIINGYLN